MPDMWLDVDVAIAECPVNILPLINATDYKTIQLAVAYNAAGLFLCWHFVTSGGVVTTTAVTPAISGNYLWTVDSNGIYQVQIPATGGATINNDTEGYGWFTGSATNVLPWRGPVIGFRAAALNDALCDGGANLLVATTSNVKKNQALANFEFLMTDSTNHQPVTGKTVTPTRSIDGGAFAAGTLSAVTEVSNGIYRVNFAAADLNGNVVTLRCVAAGCDDTFVTLVTAP